MEEFGATRELRVVKAEKRAFNINKKVYPGDPWQLVCQVDCDYGTKTVTLRSVLQVNTSSHLDSSSSFLVARSSILRVFLPYVVTLACVLLAPVQSSFVSMQVHNQLPFAIELFYKSSDSEQDVKCGDVEPNKV